MKKLMDYFGANRVADVFIEMKALHLDNKNEFDRLMHLATEKQGHKIMAYIFPL